MEIEKTRKISNNYGPFSDLAQPSASVFGIFLLGNNKILLVQKKSREIFNIWGLPGGKVQKGESMEKALFREFSEEIGLEKIKKASILFRFAEKERENKNGIGKHISYFFVVYGELEENCETCWTPKNSEIAKAKIFEFSKERKRINIGAKLIPIHFLTLKEHLLNSPQN